MNPSRNQSGVTITEVVVMLAVVFILFGMFIPRMRQPPPSNAQRIKCANNLKNTGLAVRIYAADNEGRTPGPVLLTNSSTTAANLNALHYFRQLSNELATPKLLSCPADNQRKTSESFTNFSHHNVSFFISLTADESLPNTFLAGDRNLQVDGKPVPGGRKFALSTNMLPGWTEEIHKGEGNVLLGDGSVQQFSSSRLSEAARSQNVATNFLLMP